MSKDKFKKVMTISAGQFVFSYECSMEEVRPLLTEIDILNETVREIPILPSVASSLDEELLRSSIFGTAAIEDNPLSKEEVVDLLNKGEGTKYPEKFEIEIFNLKVAYEILISKKELLGEGEVLLLDEEAIKILHGAITDGLEAEDNMPGKYRNKSVEVGDKAYGGVYRPPGKIFTIKELMKEFVLWMNSEELRKIPAPMRAALAHYYLGLIHPFGDGNGRTARLVEALILTHAGFKYAPKMLSNFYYKNKNDYFSVFSETHKGAKKKEYDVTPFVLFVLRGLVESLKEVKGRVIYIIRRLTLHDYYDSLRDIKSITKRQHDLLMLLLEYSKPFKLEDLSIVPMFIILYRNVTERTARRDLEKLVKLRLLSLSKDRVYELNFDALSRP